MKNHFLFILLSLFSLSLGAQTLTDADILEQIRQRPSRAACGHNPYEVPDCKYTAVPSGYKAFYVSHFGRHGSRYQTKEGEFSILPVLDSLGKSGLFTPAGDSLYSELRRMADVHKGNYGLLTQLGSREHAGIASRLVSREPGIFRRKDARTVSCTSTPVHRVIQSMANFSTALKGACPSLDIIYNVGLVYLPTEAKDAPGITEEDKKRLMKPLADSLVRAFPYGNDICKRLFTDAGKAAAIYGNPNKFVIKLLDAAQGYACLDIKVNPFRFFTSAELAKYAEYHNVRFAFNYGGMRESNPLMMHKADRLLRAIVRDADAAIEGNGHCADLRFGHDGNIGPLVALISPAGSRLSVPMSKAYLQWQGWKRICMATNLQMIFYRNSKGKVLVKLLLNEKEETVPELAAVSGVYYDWNELRDYLLGRIGDLKELPEYWNATVETKSAQIRELQKNEADGFYFFTDTHFPDNCGSTPSLICAINRKVTPRRSVFGGDMSTYASNFTTGIVPQYRVMQQLRGSAGFYPVRGNHDIMTDSKKIVREQWRVSDFLRSCTSTDAVYNEADDASCYYYLDNRTANIRYLFLDTSDSVRGGKVVYGISPSQMKWIVEKAVLGAPKGCKLVVLGHVPLTSEKKRGTEEAAPLVTAINNHSSFEYKGVRYDLSGRKDLSVLFVLGGHLHRDCSFHEMGVPQILTAADSYLKSPDKVGTLKAQAIDYVSISKDFKTVTLVRIGKGKDRAFDLVGNVRK